MRDYGLLLAVFFLQQILESLFGRSFGDFFLALGLYLALRRRNWARGGLLIFIGLWEGYFRGRGLLAGGLASMAVFWGQRFMEKRLNLSALWPLLFTLWVSLFLFQAIFLILVPYLLEKGLPALWWRAFFGHNLVVALELLLIVLMARERER